jgi:hypothetical protein
MPAPVTCTVSGTLYNAAGTAVSGAKVRALVMSSFSDAYGNVIAEGLYASTTTASDGTWSLAVIQTASLNQAVTFQFIYPLNNNQTYYVSYPAVIPNTTTAAFTSIVDLSSSTATVTAASTTDNLAEGSTNLYYTQARARGALSATSPISYNSSTGVISTSLTNLTSTDALAEGVTNLYYTNARADARITAQKGAASGLAPLASDSKIDVSYLPSSVVGQVSYQGSWNASTNSPTLVTSTGTKGYYYVVSVAGATNLDGITDWKLGDWAIFNGSIWQKIDNTDAVSSVNGATGVVVLSTSDIAEGTNQYSTTARIRAALSATSPVTYNSSTGVIAVTGLSGTNTGDQTITLTGDVTGSGTGSFATTLATVALNKGGTGQTTKAAAFDALQPMTTSGDIIYGGASGTGTRLAKGTDGQYLKLVSGVPVWAAAAGGTSLSLRYYGTAGSISSSYATLTYSTQDYDTNSAYSAGTFTVPSNYGGKYQINAAIKPTGGASQAGIFIGIFVNGTQKSEATVYFGGALTDSASLLVSDILNLAASDAVTIKVKSASATTILSSNFNNYVSIAYVGA